MIRLLVLLASTFFLSLAHASSEGGYYAAWLGHTPDTAPGQPVHVIVAGFGEKLETLLIQAAYSQGVHWLAADPKLPVLLLAYNEGGRAKMESLLKKWGVKNYSYRAEKFTPERIAAEASFFPKIRSLEVYSHAARDGYAVLGEEPEELFIVGDTSLQQLASRFDSKGYAIFYGCNAGYELAPYLSELWKVPVAGALTSADLQYLHSTNDFYAFNETTRPPGPWAKVNPFSFETPRACAAGGCMRMKPDPHAYDGVHGSYPSGLGFYKFFCRANSADDCAKRMASSLVGWLSLKPLTTLSPKTVWKTVLADFVCPIHGTRKIRDECLAKLIEIEAGRALNYSPFFGEEISCSFQGCDEQRTTATSTFVREYQRYLKGLELIGVK